MIASCSPPCSRGLLRRFVAGVLAVVFLAAAVVADGPQALLRLRRGNAYFAAGQYADALREYERVDASDPRVGPEVLYDRAAAQYKLGKLDEARELLVRAAGLRDAGFEARCRYALGNCDYAAALKALDGKNAQQALEAIGRAIEQYEDALRLDPSRADARANLELAARLKERIEKAAKKQPQSQPSQGTKQSKERKNQQDQQKKQPQSRPSRPNKKRGDDTQSCPNPDQQNQQDQPNKPRQSKQDEQRKQPEESKSSAESKGDQANKQKSGVKRGAAAGKEKQQAEKSAGRVPIRITREEAQRLLQKIRDAEQRRRAMLRAREAARQKPVEKDW